MMVATTLYIGEMNILHFGDYMFVNNYGKMKLKAPKGELLLDNWSFGTSVSVSFHSHSKKLVLRGDEQKLTFLLDILI